MAKQKTKNKDDAFTGVTSDKRNSPQVVTRWEHTAEPSPAFGRLMLVLLKDRSEKSGVEKKDRPS